MSYLKLPILNETGFAIVDSYDQQADPREWDDLIYVDWKSSGDTRFAPLASAYGDIECDGFWNHTPPKTDKDGVWVPENVAIAPILTERARAFDTNIGRCRVIELQPNSYTDAIYNLHRDDNNRLNPEGTGWIVRAFFNLTDDAESVMLLREVKDDPSTETLVPLPAGAQVVIDTQRLYHSVWHRGDKPRYCLITSVESAPGLDSWISARNPKVHADSPALDADFITASQAEAEARHAARAAALLAQGKDPRFGDGTMAMSEDDEYGQEVMSEA
ncbi:MAG: hypothetical protein PHU75_09320 [Candidatus Nanopelagicales bacterium]|nr:hypothetical protein [Candidatus Nanopelagicales bacterium]